MVFLSMEPQTGCNLAAVMAGRNGRGLAHRSPVRGRHWRHGEAFSDRW